MSDSLSVVAACNQGGLVKYVALRLMMIAAKKSLVQGLGIFRLWAFPLANFTPCGQSVITT